MVLTMSLVGKLIGNLIDNTEDAIAIPKAIVKDSFEFLMGNWDNNETRREIERLKNNKES
jgi:hypothetical protein